MNEDEHEYPSYMRIEDDDGGAQINWSPEQSYEDVQRVADTNPMEVDGQTHVVPLEGAGDNAVVPPPNTNPTHKKRKRKEKKSKRKKQRLEKILNPPTNFDPEEERRMRQKRTEEEMGEKAWLCSHCNESFRYKDQLNQHAKAKAHEYDKSKMLTGSYAKVCQGVCHRDCGCSKTPGKAAPTIAPANGDDGEHRFAFNPAKMFSNYVTNKESKRNILNNITKINSGKNKSLPDNPGRRKERYPTPQQLSHRRVESEFCSHS